MRTADSGFVIFRYTVLLLNLWHRYNVSTNTAHDHVDDDFFSFSMSPLIIKCDDGSCCCLTQSNMVAMISIISLMSSTIDIVTNEDYSYSSPHSMPFEHLGSLKKLLLILFQLANMLLLLSSFIKSALLLQIYLWYALGFVLIELIITILDFAFKFQVRGISCIFEFIMETIFLFVLSYCLPLVDIYRRNLQYNYKLH